MCAALAARRDPAEELDFAVSLINRVVDGFEACGSACTSAAATGAATRPRCSAAAIRPLAPSSRASAVTQLVLEYATERAGDVLAFGGKELGWASSIRAPTGGIGAIDSRRPSSDALRFYPARRMFLNPDCGFGTFSSRPMNTEATAAAKLPRWSRRRVIFAARLARCRNRRRTAGRG